MDISEYMEELNAALKQIQHREECRVMEDYLAGFAAVPPELNVAEKGVYMAEPMRGQGDVLFNDGKYEEAVVTYTHSLRISPVYSKHAALAYAQRSAASFNLRAFQECIMDIDRALDLPCPHHLKNQIKVRRASAVSMLNRCPDQATKTSPPVVEYEYAHGANPKIPGASRGLEIAYDPVGDERVLVARLPFEEGDVMAVLKPYLVVPEMEEHPTFCHHCLKKSFFILPCDTCNYEVYCSEKCRAEAFKMYHRLECKIQYTLVCSLPLNRHLLACQMRCLSIFTKQGTDLKGLQEDMKEIESSLDIARIGFTGKKFDGNTRKGFLSLGRDKPGKYNPEALLGGAYIVSLLRNHTDFFKKNSDIPIVGNLLADISTLYGAHDISIPYYRCSTTKAHATYPLLGLANHACINNTITYIDNSDRIVLRASENIKPGDKILFDCHEVDVIFGDHTIRGGRFREARRSCRLCETNYVSPLEKCTAIKMDKSLRSNLKKDPSNVDELWKLLKHVNETVKTDSMQALGIKKILIQLYEGRCNPIYAQQTLLLLGML